MTDLPVAPASLGRYLDSIPPEERRANSGQGQPHLPGVTRFQWISRGGVQIIGHRYETHIDRVLEVWWERQSETGKSAGEVSVIRAAKRLADTRRVWKAVVG